MFKRLFLLFLLYTGACTSRPQIRESRENDTVQWQYIPFWFNDTVVQVAKPGDIVEFTTPGKEMLRYPINKAELDSLFKQANELLNFKKQPERICTDYVGSLHIWIRYNSQVVKKVSFTSICDWRKLNAHTTRIDQLFKKIVEGR